MARLEIGARGASTLIALTRRRLDLISRVDSIKRLRPVMAAAQRELAARLAAIPAEQAFSRATTIAYQAQVQSVIAGLAQQLDGPISETQIQAMRSSVETLAQGVSVAQRAIGAASVQYGVLPVREIARMSGALATETTLLERFHIRRKTVIHNYGESVVRDMEQTLAKGLAQGMGPAQMADALASRNDGFKPAWWKAERIARTEGAFAFNTSTLEAGQMLADEGASDVLMRWVEFVNDDTGQPLDNRVDEDSLKMHGQLRRPGQSFWDPVHSKSVSSPPNRPNDRATLVVWRASWGEPPGGLARLDQTSRDEFAAALDAIKTAPQAKKEVAATPLLAAMAKFDAKMPELIAAAQSKIALKSAGVDVNITADINAAANAARKTALARSGPVTAAVARSVGAAVRAAIRDALAKATREIRAAIKAEAKRVAVAEDVRLGNVARDLLEEWDALHRAHLDAGVMVTTESPDLYALYREGAAVAKKKATPEAVHLAITDSEAAINDLFAKSVAAMDADAAAIKAAGPTAPVAVRPPGVPFEKVAETAAERLETWDAWEDMTSQPRGWRYGQAPEAEREVADAITLFTRGHVAACRSPSIFDPVAGSIRVPGLHREVKPSAAGYASANRICTALAARPMPPADLMRGLALERRLAEEMQPGFRFDLGGFTSFADGDAREVAERFATTVGIRLRREGVDAVDILYEWTGATEGTLIEDFSYFQNEAEYIAGGVVEVVQSEMRGEFLHVTLRRVK